MNLVAKFKSLTLIQVLALGCMLSLIFFLPDAYAQVVNPPTPPSGGGGQLPAGIGGVASNVLATLGTLVNAIAAAAYIAGIAFAIGAIMKFKQHKDNPTQIPVGTPIALLFIAAALVFLPTIIYVTGVTLFGTQGIIGGTGGEGAGKLEQQFPGGQGGQ